MTSTGIFFADVILYIRIICNFGAIKQKNIVYENKSKDTGCRTDSLGCNSRSGTVRRHCRIHHKSLVRGRRSCLHRRRPQERGVRRPARMGRQRHHGLDHHAPRQAVAHHRRLLHRQQLRQDAYRRRAVRSLPAHGLEQRSQHHSPDNLQGAARRKVCAHAQGQSLLCQRRQ